MDFTKPYEFMGFGAMDVTKAYECIWFLVGMLGLTTWGNCPRAGTVDRSSHRGGSNRKNTILENY